MISYLKELILRYLNIQIYKTPHIMYILYIKYPLFLDTLVFKFMEYQIKP